jgi:hypothetical protein
MKTKSITFVFILLLLSACAPSSTPETPIPVDIGLPTGGYQPVSEEVCQILLEDASASTGLEFSMQMSTPFTDYLTGETGTGCTLTATTDGASISFPSEASAKLMNGFIGWVEDINYLADGPTGTAIAIRRDSGLMLISVSWEPSADANCPTDQPIIDCVLTEEQRLYTVTIQAAQK